MKLLPAITTVTPLSKFLALLLFILLPFVGFWAGMEYEKILRPEVGSDVGSIVVPPSTRTDLSTPALIEQDFKRGKITDEQRVLYLTYAVYEDKSLPRQYRGTVGWDGTFVVKEIKEAASNPVTFCAFSPSVQNEVRRLLKTTVVCNNSETANWKTYRSEELQYEFNYPPDSLEPMRAMGDTSFVIGYFIDGGNPKSVQDVQNPDKTYWIRHGYISQSQLNVMGITYCGGHPNDTSRCESRPIGDRGATIDWGIPVEYTRTNPSGKEETATQTRASVWISHPKGGVVTFELQPVVPKSKETLYTILSTFRFLDEKNSPQ